MSAYDHEKLVELFGDDPTLLAEIAREFFETAREAAREIASTDEPASIARVAHRLKGASGMIGARELHDIAEAVELAARRHDLTGVRHLQARLENSVLSVAEQAGLPAGEPSFSL